METNSAFEVGRITQALEGVVKQVDKLEVSMYSKLEDLDKRLRGMSEAHPTRREFEDLKKDVLELHKASDSTALQGATVSGKVGVWDKVWPVLIGVALSVTGALAWVGVQHL